MVRLILEVWRYVSFVIMSYDSPSAYESILKNMGKNIT